MTLTVRERGAVCVLAASVGVECDRRAGAGHSLQALVGLVRYDTTIG